MELILAAFNYQPCTFPINVINWARTKLIMLLSIYLCGRGQYQEIIIKLSSIEEVQISFVIYYQQVSPNPRKVLYFLYLMKFSLTKTKKVCSVKPALIVNRNTKINIHGKYNQLNL